MLVAYLEISKRFFEKYDDILILPIKIGGVPVSTGLVDRRWHVEDDRWPR